MADAKSPPLFFQRRFLPMWTALSLGTFADNTLRQALLIGIPAGVIAVPFFDDPDNAIPYIGALLPLAILLFSSISGQLADKYETSMMFRRTKATEILLMSLAALAFASGVGGLAIAMLFAMGAQSAFFSPVRVSAMPKYLQADELVRGNGLCNAGLFTFILLGYGVGGYLIIQERGALMVGVVLVLAAFFGWLAVLRAPAAGANAPGLRLDFNALSQTLAMFRYVREAPGVTPVLLGIGFFYMASTAVTVIVPLYGRDALYADPLIWTALNGLFAVGAGIGAIAAASIAKGRTGLGHSTVAIFCAGLTLFAVFFITPFAAGAPDAPISIGRFFSRPGGILLALGLIATSAFAGVYIAPLQAALQRRAPAETRARIMAASVFTNAAFAIPGSLSVLAITETDLNPRAALPAIAAAMVGVSAIMMWRKHALPAGLYEEDLASRTDQK